MTQKPKKSPPPETREDAERILAVCASAAAEEKRLIAKLEAELVRLREAAAPELEAARAVREDAEEALASWAELHKEAFGDKRSLQMTHGVIGWRLGTPAVKTRARVKAESALALVEEHYPDFVRHATTLDKNAILAATAAGTLTESELSLVGLRVVQTERFFVEPKEEGNA